MDTQQRPRRLFVFDFDETIISDNSDTYIYRMLKEGKLPKDLQETYTAGLWNAFMNRTFEFMGE